MTASVTVAKQREAEIRGVGDREKSVYFNGNDPSI